MALAVRGPPRGALADELDSDDRDSGPDVDAKVVTAVLSDTPAASADNDEPMQAGLLPEHHGLAHEQLPLEHPHSMSHGDALPPHLHSHHSLLPHDHPLSHELAAQHIVHEHAHEHRMPHEHESTVVHAVPLHHHHALPPHLHSHGPHHHGHAVTVGLAEEQEDLIRDSTSRKRKLSANIEDDKMIGEQRDTDPAGDIPELEPAGGSDGEGAHDEETGSDVSEPHESIDEDEPIPPIRLRKINGKYYVRTNFVAPPSPITEMDRARMQPHSDELWGCVECGKTFRDTQKLKRHLKVHGEKGFVCDIDGCNKRFLDKSKLKRHQLVHTKDRPYPCSFAGCERRFSLAYNRTIHERIHTNVKPFVCDFKGCNAAFAQASNLKSHKRTHEKRRAFYCEYPGCGEEFGKRTNLKTHQKHHGELQIGHFHQHALPHAIPPPHHPHMAHAHPHPHMQQHSQSPHHSQLLPLINPITMLPHNMGPVPMHMGVHIPSVFLPHMVPLPLMGMPMGHMAPPPSAMPMPPSDDPSAVPPPPGLEQQLDDSKQGMYADPDQGTRIHLPDSAAHSDELA